ERAYADLLGLKRPEAAGARAGESTIFWAGDLRRERLAVLLLDARSPSDRDALLLAARRTAARASLREVLLWESPIGEAGSPVPEARRSPRPDSLPMLLPLAEAVRAEDWLAIPRA